MSILGLFINPAEYLIETSLETATNSKFCLLELEF